MKNKFNSLKIISFLWLGAIFGSGISFAVQVVLARTLGTESFGLFSATIGTINLIMPLAGFGVAAFWLKAFGQEGLGGMRWLRSSFNFIILSTCLVISALIIWSYLGPHDSETSALLKILSLLVLGNVALELLKSKLQLEEKYILLATWQLAYPLLKLFMVLSLVYIERATIMNVGWGFSILSIVIFSLAGVPLFQMICGKFNLQGHGKINASYETGTLLITVLEVFKQSWAFGFAGMFYIIWSTSNIVLLKYFSGNESAGIYSVSLLIINAICILPGVIYSKYLMPKIHRWANQDIPKLKETFITGNKAMLLLGVLMMLGVFLLGDFMIVNIFGSEYSESAIILLILSVTLPIKFVGHSVGSMLVAKENMNKKVKLMGIVAVLNVVINVIAIPIWGVYGVATASIISEVVLLLLYYLLVKKLYLDTNWCTTQ